jgi:hypothetical protein
MQQRGPDGRFDCRRESARRIRVASVRRSQPNNATSARGNGRRRHVPAPPFRQPRSATKIRYPQRTLGCQSLTSAVCPLGSAADRLVDEQHIRHHPAWHCPAARASMRAMALRIVGAGAAHKGGRHALPQAVCSAAAGGYAQPMRSRRAVAPVPADRSSAEASPRLRAV